MALKPPIEVGNVLDRAEVFHTDVLERQGASDRRLQEADDVNDAQAVDSALFKQESRAFKWFVTGCLRMDDRKVGIDVVK